MSSCPHESVDDPFAVVHGAAEELQTSVGYRYDNATRGDADRLVIQRTLGGSAYFRDAAGEHGRSEPQRLVSDPDLRLAYGTRRQHHVGGSWAAGKLVGEEGPVGEQERGHEGCLAVVSSVRADVDEVGVAQ